MSVAFGGAEKIPARLHLRLDPQVKHLVEQAAAISGRSITDFVVAAVRDEAQRVIEQQTRWVLSCEAFDAFADALDGPPEPNAELRRLLAG